MPVEALGRKYKKQIDVMNLTSAGCVSNISMNL